MLACCLSTIVSRLNRCRPIHLLFIPLLLLMLPGVALADTTGKENPTLQARRLAPLMSCYPMRPTPWFSEEIIEVDTSALPRGVTLGMRSDAGILILQNSSPEPLYLLGHPRFLVPPEWEQFGAHFSQGMAPIYQLKENQALRLTPDLRWEEEKGVSSHAVWLAVASDGIYTRWGKMGGFTNQYKEGDNRPPDTSVPAPQNLALALRYGDQELIVPLTVGYRLNPHYRPNSVAESRASCDFNWGMIIVLAGLVYVVVPLSLLTSLIWAVVLWARGEGWKVVRTLKVLGVVALFLVGGWQLSLLPRQHSWDLASSTHRAQVEWDDYRYRDARMFYKNVIATVTLPGQQRVEQWHGTVIFVRSLLSLDHVAAVQFSADPTSPTQMSQRLSSLRERYGFDQDAQSEIDAWRENSDDDSYHAIERVIETEHGFLSIELGFVRLRDKTASSSLTFRWME
jgi:hypothetical protein